MNSKNTKKLETFYSPYGYIEVSKEEYESSLKIIKFTKKNCLTGSINKEQLSKKITVNLKTFYGKRKKYPLIVSIDEQLIDIIYHLISAEMNQNPEEIFNINSQYRLISSISTLRELNLYKTFEEENIKDNEILLILKPETIKFSLNLKTSHITLENKRKVATKLDIDDFEFCLTEPGIKYGKRYIEFILESEPFEKNIMIGISLFRNNFKFNESKDFFGFLLSENQKVYNLNGKMKTEKFGINTKIGDKIGMLFELTLNERKLSYYINKNYIGIAFDNLPNELLFPCVCLGFPGTKIKVDSEVDFPQLDN